jgi:hypothetical protein
VPSQTAVAFPLSHTSFHPRHQSFLSFLQPHLDLSTRSHYKGPLESSVSYTNEQSTAPSLTMNKNPESPRTTIPTPALKDGTPVALLVNYQLRRENAALLTQLQDILLAVKAADGERKEEVQRLVDEVRAVARTWDGASERVKGLVGVTAEMMKELRGSCLSLAVMRRVLNSML